MNYAMVLNSFVIEVLQNCEVEPKWPPDPDGKHVTAVLCDESVQRGMHYDAETGIFEFLPTFEDIVVEKLSESEERQIDILLNTEYIACLLESQLM